MCKSESLSRWPGCKHSRFTCCTRCHCRRCCRRRCGRGQNASSKWRGLNLVRINFASRNATCRRQCARTAVSRSSMTVSMHFVCLERSGCLGDAWNSQHVCVCVCECAQFWVLHIKLINKKFAVIGAEELHVVCLFAHFAVRSESSFLHRIYHALRLVRSRRLQCIFIAGLEVLGPRFTQNFAKQNEFMLQLQHT